MVVKLCIGISRGKSLNRFQQPSASTWGVDAVIPVDVYIPGCAPRPEALLHGILLALGQVRQRIGCHG
jgi:NADH:ubiquinone oxidoreductase subunit B-like Fe-S oxidoreductase